MTKAGMHKALGLQGETYQEYVDYCNKVDNFYTDTKSMKWVKNLCANMVARIGRNHVGIEFSIQCKCEVCQLTPEIISQETGLVTKCNKIFRRGFFDLDDIMIEILKEKIQKGTLKIRKHIVQPTAYMDSDLQPTQQAKYYDPYDNNDLKILDEYARDVRREEMLQRVQTLQGYHR